MEIICESCKARLNVPDEKIPEEQVVSFSCPKCQSKVKVGPSGPSKETGISRPPQQTASKETANTSAVHGEHGLPLVYYEEGVKLALLMEDVAQPSKDLKQFIEELDYTVVIAENTRDAIGKMRFHHFGLIILSDRFDDMALDQSPVIQYLNNLSMSSRRRIFFMLIGDGFKTMDPMMAFAASANLVINTGDLKKLKDILRGALSENEKFYSVYMRTLESAGKI